MLNQTELLMLKKSDPIDHFLLVRKSEIRLTKSNKQYLSLDLGDKTTTINSNIWDNFETIYDKIKPGDVVKVTAR